MVFGNFYICIITRVLIYFNNLIKTNLKLLHLFTLIIL
nr:MAG TPA: hypothetical protein [Caudoviricetes sp.]